jgi:hypothetical protein
VLGEFDGLPRPQKRGTWGTPLLVKGDKNGEAEAEDEDGDEEVAVGEDGFGTLGFVHRGFSGSGFDFSSEQGLKPTLFHGVYGTTKVVP